jgi:GDSL-like Lipase/Acylhydrolase family/SsfX3, N-terminal domain
LTQESKTMFIPSSDQRLTYCGAVSVQSNENWSKPWRMPWQDIELYPPELLPKLETPAGVRIRFATDSVNIKLIPAPLTAAGQVDLVINDEIIETVEFKQTAAEIAFAPLPSGKKTIELWLSQKMPMSICGIEIDDTATLKKSEDNRPKWITYGSSITQCGAAASPATTWPAIVARTRGLNLTCLGFGGQCHGDPVILKMIRDMPVDIVSMCLGINIHGNGSFNQRSFRPMVIGAIMTVRENHPDVPLVITSPIYCSDREDTPTPGNSGLSLKMMRDEISTAVEIMQARGDKKLFYLNGLDLFDVELAEYLPDGLHPDADGYHILGENFLREVFELSDAGKMI